MATFPWSAAHSLSDPDCRRIEPTACHCHAQDWNARDEFRLLEDNENLALFARIHIGHVASFSCRRNRTVQCDVSFVAIFASGSMSLLLNSIRHVFCLSHIERTGLHLKNHRLSICAYVATKQNWLSASSDRIWRRGVFLHGRVHLRHVENRMHFWFVRVKYFTCQCASDRTIFEETNRIYSYLIKQIRAFPAFLDKFFSLLPNGIVCGCSHTIPQIRHLNIRPADKLFKRIDSFDWQTAPES